MGRKLNAVLPLLGALGGIVGGLTWRAMKSRPEAHQTSDGAMQVAPASTPDNHDQGHATLGVGEFLAPSSSSESGASAIACSAPTACSPEEDLSTPHGVDYVEIAARLALEDDDTPHVAVLATTLDLWNSEPFKALTLADVRGLLPDADVDLSGDGLFLERIGGLPTEADALHALDSAEVQDALYKFLVADGVAAEFALNPNTTPEYERLLDNAERARDAAQESLYRALDGAGQYKNWALLGALWRAFDAE